MTWCWTARKRLNSDLDTLLQLNRQRAEYYGGTTHRCYGNRRTGASGTGVEGLRALVAEGWASGARLGRGGRRGGVLGAGDGWRSRGERQWRVGASRGVAEWESRRVAEWASRWVSEVRRRRRAVGRHGVGGVGAPVDRVWNGSGGFCCVMGQQKKKRRTLSSMAPTPSASARLSIFRRHREFSQAKNLRYMFPGGNNYFHESSCQEITIFHGGLHSTLTKIGFHDGICSTSTKNTNFMRVCFKLSRKIHPLTKSRFCGSDT